MAVYCKYCNAHMTSAPSHMEHESACGKGSLFMKIEEYVIACGGDPSTKNKLKSVKRKQLGEELEALIAKIVGDHNGY